MFSRATLGFLDDLAANNNRAWFDANRLRYESEVREPALTRLNLILFSTLATCSPSR